eukprot:4504429-Amphidinium_carterae.1
MSLGTLGSVNPTSGAEFEPEEHVEWNMIASSSSMLDVICGESTPNKKAKSPSTTGSGPSTRPKW